MTSNSTSAPVRSSSVSNAAASSAKSRSAPYRARLRMRGGFAPALPDPAGCLGGGRADRAGGRGGLGHAVAHAEPLAAVAAHVVDQRHQGLALGRERVLDPRRDLGIGVALDYAVLLERAQPQRERAWADPRERPLELTEAAAALGKIADHEDRPLAANDVRSRADGTCGIRHTADSSSRLHKLKRGARRSAGQVAEQPAATAAALRCVHASLARLHQYPAGAAERHLDRLARAAPDEVLELDVGLDARLDAR